MKFCKIEYCRISLLVKHVRVILFNSLTLALLYVVDIHELLDLDHLVDEYLCLIRLAHLHRNLCDETKC